MQAPETPPQQHQLHQPLHQPQPSKADRSVGELLSDLAQDTSQLVRQEVSLATAEMTQKASQAARSIGLLVVGGAFAFLALEMLVNSGVVLLAGMIPLEGIWPALVAFLIVFSVVAIISAVLIRKGLKSLRADNIMPRQTIDTLKEDVQWAKQQTKQPGA